VAHSEALTCKSVVLSGTQWHSVAHSEALKCKSVNQ
jgi:hypothetical protein